MVVMVEFQVVCLHTFELSVGHNGVMNLGTGSASLTFKAHNTLEFRGIVKATLVIIIL